MPTLQNRSQLSPFVQVLIANHKLKVRFFHFDVGNRPIRDGMLMEKGYQFRCFVPNGTLVPPIFNSVSTKNGANSLFKAEPPHVFEQNYKLRFRNRKKPPNLLSNPLDYCNFAVRLLVLKAKSLILCFLFAFSSLSQTKREAHKSRLLQDQN
jgi:hypothetical protein